MKTIIYLLMLIFLCNETWANKKDTTFYKNGKIKKIEDFDNNGKEHGKRLAFLENGQKVVEIDFKHGEYHGLIQGWHSNGNRKYLSHNNNGIQYGWSTHWDSLCFPSDSTMYANDKMEERYLFYNGSRIVRKHEYFFYNDGKRLLVMEDTYSKNGKLISQIRNGNGFSFKVGENDTYSGIEVYKDGKSDYKNFISTENRNPRHKRKPIPKNKIVPWDVEKYGKLIIR